jgi:thioredoxin-related protein
MRWIIALCFTTFLMAEELNWHKHAYSMALQDAKISGKPMMIMFSAKHCRACIWMKESVIARPDINEYLAKNYVLAMIDIDKDPIPKNFEVVGTPMFYFQDAKEKFLHKRLIGGKKPDYFLKLLKKITKK